MDIQPTKGEVMTPEELSREWKVSRNLIYRELRSWPYTSLPRGR